VRDEPLRIRVVGGEKLQACIDEMLQTVGNEMQTILTSVFQPALKQLKPVLEEYEQVLPPFFQVLAATGWPPPAMMSPFDLMGMRAVVQARDHGLEEAEAKLTEIMLAAHSGETVASIAERWGNRYLLRRRRHILRAAINAHLRGDYECSVPTFLSQIEGVVVDGYGHVGWLKPKTYVGYVDRLGPEEMNEGRGDIVAEVRRATRHFYRHVVLADFIHGHPIPSNLSRHAILHGADTGYGRVASLKALLLVEAVQDCFQFVALEQSQVYHLAGCSFVRGAKQGLLHYEGRWAAGEERRPCRICRPADDDRT